MKGKQNRTVSLIALTFFVFSTAMVANVFATKQGCTPGFWKVPQHFVYWTFFTPQDTVAEAFLTDDWAPEYDFLKGMTLLEVLEKKGGKGQEFTQRQQAARIFLRQAVAALLNTANPNIDYYNQISSVQGHVNLVLNLQYDLDADAIEAQKNVLQNFNELGSPICD